jgi:hypothetical protein
LVTVCLKRNQEIEMVLTIVLWGGKIILPNWDAFFADNLVLDLV